MFSNLSSHVTDNLIQTKVVDQEDREIYEYGLGIFFTYLLDVVTILLIGIVMGQLWACILFQLIFLPLRSYAGGYHASSELRCYFLSVGMVVLALVLLRYLLIWTSANAGLFVLIPAYVIIMLLAPVENKNKPLDEDEIRVYGKRARMVLLIETVIGIFCYLFSYYMFFWAIVLAILSVSLSLMAGACANRRYTS